MDINRNGVDMLIDKKRLNIYFAFVIISVIAVDLFMFNREGIHGNGIDSCAYDGIFVWGVYKMLIIGFFPIIMISIWGAMHDEISRNICIVRMNSRFKLWLRQERLLLVLSIVTIIISMLISFCMAYMLNGRLSWPEYIERDGQVIQCPYLYIAADVWNPSIADNFRFIPAVIAAIVINSLWVFIFVTFTNILWWICNKKYIGVLVTFCICMPLAFIRKLGIAWVYKLCDFTGIKLFEHEYYRELIYPDRLVHVLTCQLVIIAVMFVISGIITRKKNFI